MSKLNKADHDTLRRALTTHVRVTGEKAVHLIDSIEVADPEGDQRARAEAQQRSYDAQAVLSARVEETQQAERQAREAASAAGGDGVQPGNPGAGNEALATERAKAAGHTRHGEEPSTAQPKK